MTEGVETADRLVIRAYPGCWKVSITDPFGPRLLADRELNWTEVGDPKLDLTAIGGAVVERLNMVDGLKVQLVLRHGVTCKLSKDVPRDWSEVEPDVIAAFNDATGLTHEVVRLPGT